MSLVKLDAPIAQASCGVKSLESVRNCRYLPVFGTGFASCCEYAHAKQA